MKSPVNWERRNIRMVCYCVTQNHNRKKKNLKKKSSSKPQILSVDPLGTLNVVFLFIKTLLNTEMQPLVGCQCSGDGLIPIYI